MGFIDYRPPAGADADFHGLTVGRRLGLLLEWTRARPGPDDRVAGLDGRLVDRCDAGAGPEPTGVAPE